MDKNEHLKKEPARWDLNPGPSAPKAIVSSKIRVLVPNLETLLNRACFNH